MKPTVHMLCGFICSGKTTFARNLAGAVNGVIFSPDEWIAELSGKDHSDEFVMKYGHRVATLMYKVYARLLEINIDVILDDGFWSRASRDQMRKKAAEIGVNHQLYFLSCPENILLERVRQRNTELEGGSVFISESKFTNAKRHFEAPGEDEIFELIVTGT